MIPSSKSPAVNQAITFLFGIDREKSIHNNKCVFCGKEINVTTEFKDELSRREFTISGICQTCQDKTFK